MKKKQLIIFSGLIILLILISNSQSYSQWIDKTNYKELIASDSPIIQLITPKNDSCFYTVDSKLNFRKYNYNGNLLFEKKMKKLDTVDFKCVSLDGKSAIYHYKYQNGYNYTVYWAYKVKILDIETDKELRNEHFTLLEYSGGSSGNTNLNSIDYKTSIQKLMFAYGIYIDLSLGNLNHIYEGTGHINILDFVNAKSNDVIDGDGGAMAYNEDLNILAGVRVYTKSRSEGSYHTTTESNYTRSFFYFDKIRKIYFDLSRSYTDYMDNSKNYSYGLIPDWMRLSNKDSSVIGFKDSLMVDYKIIADKNFTSTTCYLKSSPLDMQLSPSDNFYIFLMKDNRISILDRTWKTELEEFRINDSVSLSKLRISSDGTGIMAAGGNKIYLFESVYFSDQLHSLFSIKSTNVHQNDTLRFKNASTGNPDEYYWDFGDSTYSNEKHPQHIYTTPGIYTVKLLVKKGNLSDSLTKVDYIVVNPELKADFEANSIQGQPPLTVNFTDKSTGNINRWLWDFADGTKDSTQNPEHVYVNSGIYPIRLIVSDTVSSDTLIKWDYINVAQTAITDTSILSEKIFWFDNVNIDKTEGFDIVNGNYLIELLTGNDIKLIMFDRNFDTLWTRHLFNGYHYCPIRKSKNGTMYVVGDLEYKPGINSVNKIDTSGQITNLLSYFASYVFDYYPSDSTIAVYMNYYTPYNIELNIYDLKSGLISEKSYYYMNGLPNYTYAGKIDHYGSGYYFYALNYMKNNDDKPALLKLYIMYVDTKPDRLSGRLGSDRDKRTVLTDFKVVNDSNYISIEDNELLLSRRFSTNINFSSVLPGVKFYSIAVLKDSTFAACGSKNGNCWYGIFKITGDILEEHEVTNRKGSFKSISLNEDGSLLLVGSLYKYTFDGLFYPSKSNNDIMLSDTYPGLLICRSKPSPLTSIENVRKLPDEIIVYPNPTDGDFSINLPDNMDLKNNHQIIITDLNGIKLFETNAGFRIENGNIRLKTSLPDGVYFIQLTDGETSYSAKLIIKR